jgi:hypothetical protein
VKWLALAPVALALSAPRAHADSATAAAAFKQAEALVKQGKWAEACPLYEVSYQADPQLGALLYLAECYEHVGKTASAWSVFNDAIDLARRKGDPREERIRKRADALAPQLSKTTINAPKPPIPGLTVKRGNVDITVLVGSNLPIDPGDHDVIASAPGHVEWKKQVRIAPASSTTLDIPPLEKVVEQPGSAPPPIAQEGTLNIKTLPNAKILLDGEVVGTGSYEGKVGSGGHTLRVVADGMRPYQAEVVISTGQTRTIDVPLEREVAAGATTTVSVAPPREPRPTFETGASLSSGVKVRNGNPLVVTMRADIGLRLGRRTNFGAYVEYGQIDTSDRCGLDMAGPIPATDFDFGPRNQLTKCDYILTGLQLYVHILPKGKIDPFIGFTPGFRFGLLDWTPYIAGMPQTPQSTWLPGIVATLRAGASYHPKPGLFGWQFGAYLEAAFTVAADESGGNTDDDGPQQYINIHGGARASWAF